MIFATQLRLPQRCDKNGCGCWFFSCLIGIWNQVKGRASYWFIIVVVKKVCACFGCQRIYCNAKNINLSMMRRFECSQGPAIPSILLGFLPWGVSCTWQIGRELPLPQHRLLGIIRFIFFNRCYTCYRTNNIGQVQWRRSNVRAPEGCGQSSRRLRDSRRFRFVCC